MCTYCGSEIETELCSLADDHAEMEDLAGQVCAALDAHEPARAQALVGKLLELFDDHVAEEESGLFRQLREAGEAGDKVDSLESEHRTLRREFSLSVLDGLRGIDQPLSQLCRHADVEDADLFPFAQQVLSDKRWASLLGHPHRAKTDRLMSNQR